MQKVCQNQWCQAPFEVTAEDLAFYDKVSPVFAGKKCAIPPPTQCPECRLRRRLVFRNQIQVYKTKSALTGKEIMSMYTQESGVQVMEIEEWWKDRHDPLTYGKEWDPSASFFGQCAPLLKQVPLFSLSNLNTEKSEFSNNASFLKNTYLIFNVSHAEDCMYCENMWHCKDCVDCSNVYGCELCLNCTACNTSYNLQESEFSDNCSDSFFLSFCRGCKHCFGCANLRNAEYCFMNEQLSRQEYEKRLKEIDLSSFTLKNRMRQTIEENVWRQSPRPHMVGSINENSTGNFLSETQNVSDSFFVKNAQNVRYGFNNIDNVRDCMDFTIYGDGAELIYEGHIVGDQAYHLCFCNECWGNVSELYYCQFCVACSECFGCVGLHYKKFCILNKQYSKEEYEKIVPTIIEAMRKRGEWGEFFPEQTTTYAYNHTLAERYFPLTKEQALAEGFLWHERETEDVSKAVDAGRLPDGLPATDDPIIVRSTLSGRPFRITAQEIKRYRALKTPLPRMTYDERMEWRAKRIGGITLFARTCAKTGTPIRTTCPPDSPWIIWDKDVYEAEFGS